MLPIGDLISLTSISLAFSKSSQIGPSSSNHLKRMRAEMADQDKESLLRLLQSSGCSWRTAEPADSVCSEFVPRQWLQNSKTCKTSYLGLTWRKVVRTHFLCAGLSYGMRAMMSTQSTMSPVFLQMFFFFVRKPKLATYCHWTTLTVWNHLMLLRTSYVAGMLRARNSKAGLATAYRVSASSFVRIMQISSGMRQTKCCWDRGGTKRKLQTNRDTWFCESGFGDHRCTPFFCTLLFLSLMFTSRW